MSGRAGERSTVGGSTAAAHRGPGLQSAARGPGTVEGALASGGGGEAQAGARSGTRNGPNPVRKWGKGGGNEEYIARMEDVLAVYEKPLAVREPVVCIDEKPVVLHQEVRPPVAMQPGRVARRLW